MQTHSWKKASMKHKHILSFSLCVHCMYILRCSVSFLFPYFSAMCNKICSIPYIERYRFNGTNNKTKQSQYVHQIQIYKLNKFHLLVLSSELKWAFAAYEVKRCECVWVLHIYHFRLCCTNAINKMINAVRVFIIEQHAHWETHFKLQEFCFVFLSCYIWNTRLLG